MAPRKPGVNIPALKEALDQAKAETSRSRFGSTTVTILGVDGQVVIDASSFSEVQRASRYDNDIDTLLSGRMTPGSFDRRWAGRTIGGEELATSERVLYLARIGEAYIDDFYPERGFR